MTKITASDVKKLRDITGAGMMDCKNALSEANGNIEEAIDNLRKRGQKLSAKRADRDAKEGVVMAVVNDAQTDGIIIKLSSETDFVAKNDDFINLAKKVAQLTLDNMPADKDALLNIKFNDSLTIGDKITEQVGVIGEKIEVADYKKISAGLVVPYIHMGYRAGVLTGLSKDGGDDVVQAGKDVSMQIAAMRPIALNKDEVDQSVIEKEIEIGREQALAEGKPEQIVDKIAKGKLGKFFKENTLLQQAFVKDNSMSVEEYVKSIDKDLTVTGFRHIELG